MNPTQTVDNDLQKAIDDITNTTNIDPVFSDPVAAPSSVPEGDTGELAESVGPFPTPTLSVIEQSQPQMAPLEPISIPEPNFQPAQPAEPSPVSTFQPQPFSAPAPAQPPVQEPTTFANYTQSQSSGLNTHQVREAALRDLVPLLSHLNMDPSQKFNLYCDIFENLRDYTILEPAYQAAREIPNEQERAEALLYLVEAIDKM